MPEPLSKDQLKNRLLGAGILVVLAVLLIPLFLGDPKHEVEEVQEPKSGEFESRIQPLPKAGENPDSMSNAQQEEIKESGGLVLKKLDDKSSTVTQPSTPSTGIKIKPLDMQQANSTPEKAVTSQPQAPSPVVKPKPKPKPAAKPKSVAKPAPKPAATEIKSGWVVQIGVYSKSANASGVAADLKNIGYAPKVSDVGNNKGQKRVWIGPYATKAEAQKVSKRLADKRGDGGYVKEYPF